MLIEVFKSGTHCDSKGRTHNYNDNTIEQIVNSYNSKISQDISFMAPIVKGHPSDDMPAYGWVEYLVKKGKTILAKIKNIDPEFASELKTGKYKKVSVALYPDNMLKHIGFLGAAAPAVKGLKPVEFNQDCDDIYLNFDYENYSEWKEETSNELINNKILQLEQKIKYYEEVLDNFEKDNRLSKFRDYCNSFISNENQKGIKPIYIRYLTDILEMANTLDNQVNDNQNSKIVKEFIEHLSLSIDTSEYSVSKTEVINLKNSFEGKKVNENRMILHNKALEIINNNPKLSYNEAITMAFK